MIKAEIVADSLSPQGDRLVSVLCTFPRIILAEVNTHRMLSGNTSSSRAIPFFKAVESVINNTFIPIAWQTHHKGMQGSEYISADTVIPSDMFFYDFIKLIEAQAEEDKVKLTKEFYDVIKSLKHTFDSIFSNGSYTISEFWVKTRDLCVFSATMLYTVGKVSKQICNRLLEPFMWTVKLITGNAENDGWDNFFKLRCPQYKFISDITGNTQYLNSKSDWLYIAESEPTRLEEHNRRLEQDPLPWYKINEGLAEIHIMALAECIWDAFTESTPKQLKAGEWHVPFGDKITTFDNPVLKDVIGEIPDRVKISTSMGARTSYTVVGEEKDIDNKTQIGLHDRLIAQNPPHSSPMEHCARVMSDLEYNMNTKGLIYPVENRKDNIFIPDNDSRGWCRNFRGFIPYRHIIETNSNL